MSFFQNNYENGTTKANLICTWSKCRRISSMCREPIFYNLSWITYFVKCYEYVVQDASIGLIRGVLICSADKINGIQKHTKEIGKNKYHRGCTIKEGWAIWMVERTPECRIIIIRVEQRDLIHYFLYMYLISISNRLYIQISRSLTVIRTTQNCKPLIIL